MDNGSLIQLEPDNSKESTFFNPQIYLNVYPDESTARSAASTGEIQGFAILPEDYAARYQLTYWTNKQPDSSVQSVITDFISANLMAAEEHRLCSITSDQRGQLHQSAIIGRPQTSDGTGWHRIVVPAVIGILNFIVVMTSGGYLLKALVEEKENRTIEIMLTSVPSREIMAGKIVGNLSVGLTQIVVWVLLLGIADFCSAANGIPGGHQPFRLLPGDQPRINGPLVPLHGSPDGDHRCGNDQHRRITGRNRSDGAANDDSVLFFQRLSQQPQRHPRQSSEFYPSQCTLGALSSHGY